MSELLNCLDRSEMEEHYLGATANPALARMLTQAFSTYARQVIEQGKEELFTRFEEPLGSTSVHGWDLLLAGAEAVMRTFDLDGLSQVPSLTFRSPVLGNVRVHAIQGEQARPEDALAYGTFYSRNDGVFTVHFTPSSRPFLPSGSTGLMISPFAAAFSALSQGEDLSTVPLAGIPQAVKDAQDFGDAPVALNIAYYLLTSAGSRLLPPDSGERTLIAGIKGLSVPSFRTLIDLSMVIRSELIGEGRSKGNGVRLATVTSYFFSPRNGRDGACTTTYAMPTQAQLKRLAVRSS